MCDFLWRDFHGLTVLFSRRLYETEELHNPQMILIVGVIGLIINLVGLVLFHGKWGWSALLSVHLSLPSTSMLFDKN